MLTLSAPTPSAKALPILLACLLMGGSAWAQTPARNLMPDGSHDMYLGLGLISQARYEGAGGTQQHALGVVQVQTANGWFISGSQMGWHLSEQPNREFGPLLALQQGRSVSARRFSVLGSGDLTGLASINSTNGNRLADLEEIPARLLAGGFYHQALSSNLRWKNSLLYGAGKSRTGLRFTPELQYVFTMPHASVAVVAGFEWGNQAYNQAFFGVPAGSVLRAYRADAGVKDIHLGVNWNWALSSSWLLTSSVKFTRLQGSAASSPLVERRNATLLSTALAYRF
jgi:MipA family protein